MLPSGQTEFQSGRRRQVDEIGGINAIFPDLVRILENPRFTFQILTICDLQIPKPGEK
jgi:hypothetical protein